MVKYCSKCGKKILTSDNFCKDCGKSLKPKPDEKKWSRESRLICGSLILAVAIVAALGVYWIFQMFEGISGIDGEDSVFETLRDDLEGTPLGQRCLTDSDCVCETIVSVLCNEEVATWECISGKCIFKTD